MQAPRTHRRLFLAALLASGITGCNKPPEWHRVSPQDARFTVLMPVRPREAHQTASTEYGPLQVRFFEAETDDGSVVYSVTYTDYPFDRLDDTKSKALLRDARSAMVRDISGTVEREEETSFQGLPARRTDVTAATGVEYSVLVVLAGSRLYQVFTASRPGKLPEERKNKFFGSFAIQPRGGALDANPS